MDDIVITKHLENIERNLSNFEKGIVSLEGLQANIEGELGTLEGPLASGLVQVLGNFVNQLELYIYSLPEHQRSAKVSEAIQSLRAALGGYVG